MFVEVYISNTNVTLLDTPSDKSLKEVFRELELNEQL